MAQCADLLDPLYQLMKKELLGSKVIGTDDTSVKVLDRKLPFARIGRIWPYVGDAHHPVIVYDYTPTRSRAGPAKFLEDICRPTPTRFTMHFSNPNGG
jgi:transposase